MVNKLDSNLFLNIIYLHKFDAVGKSALCKFAKDTSGGKMKISMNVLRAGLLIMIVALVGVLWGLSSASAQSTKPPPPPTPQILENGWYGFTDSEAGYSISFPPGSKLRVSRKTAPNYCPFAENLNEIINYPTPHMQGVR